MSGRYMLYIPRCRDDLSRQSSASKLLPEGNVLSSRTHELLSYLTPIAFQTHDTRDGGDKNSEIAGSPLPSAHFNLFRRCQRRRLQAFRCRLKRRAALDLSRLHASQGSPRNYGSKHCFFRLLMRLRRTRVASAT